VVGLVRGSLLLVAVVACSSRPPADHPGSGSTTTGSSGSATPSTPATVIDLASAKASLGKQVTVQGTAKVAKLGPVVVAADLVVYCLGIAAWSDAVSNKPVTAHGMLQQTDEFAAQQGPYGEVSAGTSGSVFVLRECGYDQP
jgi:hypothetical protein